MHWQPIETAPKDGTLLILMGFEFGQVDWINVSAFESDLGRWIDVAGSEWGRCRASHWMPFLAPIDTRSGETEGLDPKGESGISA